MTEAFPSHGVTPVDMDEKLQQARSVGGHPPEENHGVGKNLPALLAQRALDHPDKPFLTFYADGDQPESVLTYGEFRQKVLSCATWLRHQGMGKRDRIATLASNHPDTVIQYFAIWELGATLVPLNGGEDDDRLCYILSDAQVKLVFVGEQYVGRYEKLKKPFRRLEGFDPGRDFPKHIVVGGPKDEFAAVRETTTTEATHHLPGPLDQALIVYTSGTTGAPKGVVLCQDNLLVDAENIAAWHRLGADQVMMCVLPIHHVNGTVVTFATPLFAGASVVLNSRFQTSTFWQRLAREKVSIVSVVPTLLKFLLEGEDIPKDLDLSAFRHIICGAGPLTVELAQKFEVRFGYPIVHGYGLSETTCYSCFLPEGLSEEDHVSWMRDFGYPSIGVPLPCNDMAIHDGDGNSIAEGERGEIVIRGHNVMLGYYNNEEANRSTFAHGWFRSGDEGFMKKDKQGRPYFFITGRLKELIIRGGVNLAPLEIDEVINLCPGVDVGISVGFDNEWYGEEVGAYVRKKDPALDEQSLLDFCAERLPFAKRPKVIVFGEDIPVTSTGKYQRNKIKHHFVKFQKEQFRK